MKKILLSLGLLVGLTSVASAQSRFGVKAGLNLANISAKDIEGNKNLLGAAVGVMADVSFSDLISFHPELLYSQKGVRTSSAGIDVNSRANYIDLPLLLRVKADGLFFEAGPQAGYLVSRKVTADGTTIGTSTEGSRKLDVGYIAGVGYQLPMGVEFGVRYNGGISALSDPAGPTKVRNSVFQFQVGYLFGGK